MTDLLKGVTAGQAFQFAADAIEAFERIKTAFTTAPLLKHFDPSKKVYVETDASGFALGGVATQMHTTEIGGKPGTHRHPFTF